jgi:hypothetical protein
MKDPTKSPSSPQPEATSGQGKRPRKPYRSPELVEYGSVAKLTQGSVSATSDGKTGGKKGSICL